MKFVAHLLLVISVCSTLLGPGRAFCQEEPEKAIDGAVEHCEAVKEFNRLTGTQHSCDEMSDFTSDRLVTHNKALRTWQKKTARLETPPKSCTQLIAWVCESQALISEANGQKEPPDCRKMTKNRIRPFRARLKNSHCRKVYSLAAKADKRAAAGKHKKGLAFAALLVQFFEKIVEGAKAEEEAAKAKKQSEQTIATCRRLSKKCQTLTQRFIMLDAMISKKGMMNLSEQKRMEWYRLNIKLKLCKATLGPADTIARYDGEGSPDRLPVCRSGLEELEKLND